MCAQEQWNINSNEYSAALHSSVVLARKDLEKVAKITKII